MTHEDFEAIAALAAAGAATREEEQGLSEHVTTCSDCRRVRDEYREAATLMATSLDPVTPPADVRERILASSPQSEETSSGGNAWWLATAATLFLALWGWREMGMRVMRERVSSQRAEIQQLSEHNRTLSLQRDKLSAAMGSLASEGTQAIALSGQQVAPSASARVYLEPAKRSAVVFFTNLPQNPDDKSYQLWVIRGDQPEPQSVGVFDVQKGTAAITIENLPIATEIKGLAVTLERRGGVPQPSSRDFYVFGGV